MSVTLVTPPTHSPMRWRFVQRANTLLRRRIDMDAERVVSHARSIDTPLKGRASGTRPSSNALCRMDGQHSRLDAGRNPAKGRREALTGG
jgi:hypothetical protein